MAIALLCPHVRQGSQSAHRDPMHNTMQTRTQGRVHTFKGPWWGTWGTATTPGPGTQNECTEMHRTTRMIQKYFRTLSSTPQRRVGGWDGARPGVSLHHPYPSTTIPTGYPCQRPVHSGERTAGQGAAELPGAADQKTKTAGTRRGGSTKRMSVWTQYCRPSQNIMKTPFQAMMAQSNWGH